MNARTYDPRTIALLSEIIYPPVELQAAKVQSIHNELYGHHEFSYQNFGVTPQGIALSNAGEQPGYVSSVTFLPDRMHVREELSGAHVDDFSRRLEHVVGISVQRLGLPILVAQQHVVRMLVNPRHFADSREFLAGGVCGLPADDFAPFGRAVGLFGVKMIFPASETSNDVHTLRIESFNQDPRCVFLEDIATFTTAIVPDKLSMLGENTRQTYAFLRDKVLAFLARYDEESASE